MPKQGVKKVLYIADIHYPFHDHRCFSLFKQIGELWKPDILVFMGDCINATGISKFTLKDYEDGIYQTIDEIFDFKQYYFEPLVKACGDPEVRYIKGNHDGRRIDQVLEKLKEKCCHKKYLDYKDKLNLQKYFPKVTFTEYPACDKIGKLYLTHGEYHNEAHAKKHALVYGKSVLYGHLHTDDRKTVPTKATNKIHRAISMPCAMRLGVEYMKNRSNSWVQGYAFAYHYPDGQFDLETKTILKGRTIFEGNFLNA